MSLQPAQVHRFWRGLPLHLDGVDAVYERASDHKIIFFKGGRAPGPLSSRLHRRPALWWAVSTGPERVCACVRQACLPSTCCVPPVPRGSAGHTINSLE